MAILRGNHSTFAPSKMRIGGCCCTADEATNHNHSMIVWLSIFGLSVVLVRRWLNAKRRIGGRTKDKVALHRGFDVIVVGAGPAGATAGFFLAKKGRRVLLVDKKTFPRAKPCGDAWCAPALTILEEMGILAKMEAEAAHPVRRGGFISPRGIRCISYEYGAVTGCKTYAIKREIADEYLARAAAEAGCEFREATTCHGASFADGLWTVDLGETVETCGVLVVCDGATSYLAKKLGMLDDGPDSVCSHSYAAAGSHSFDADGVMLFNTSLLPGYSALFKHRDGDCYFGTYVLPGGLATSRDIAPFEADAFARQPYVRDALTPDVRWSERRVVAPIRTGGVAADYDACPRCLLVGDAAGMVDPLTGEGIHTAMLGAKIAAHCVDEMYATGDFSRAAVRAYELRCYDAFGFEFISSAVAARVIAHCPLLLDALAAVGAGRGQAFLDFFGEVMTGCRPKSHFLTADPRLVVDVALAVVSQFVQQKVFRRPPLQPPDVGLAALQARRRKEQQTKRTHLKPA